MRGELGLLSPWWWWFSHSVMCNSLGPRGLQPASILCPWTSLGKNTGVDCHFLPLGALPDPGIEPASPALTVGFSTTEPPGEHALGNRDLFYFSEGQPADQLFFSFTYHLSLSTTRGRYHHSHFRGEETEACECCYLPTQLYS